MASLILKPTGKYMVKFYRDKRPVHVQLPTGDKKQAQTILNMVERRLVQMKTREPDRLLDNWITGLSDDMRSRLERCGLLEAIPDTPSLVSISVEYMEAKQTTWKQLTLVRRQNEHRWLEKYFGDRKLDTITKKDGSAYMNWLILEQKLSNTFVNKLMKWATSVYDYAIENEYISKVNPFKGVRVPNKVQREKQYISLEYTEKLIEVCPTPQWKAIVALLRFGGLRPEEAILAEWKGIDWETGTFTFRSPKTEHHPGKEQRTIPLFPKLKTMLEELFKTAKKKDKYILTGSGWDGKREAINAGRAGTMCELTKYITKAGLDNPGSLPTNMRGSCSSDLKQAFPEYVVDSWLGHSSDIAHKHYDVVTQLNLKLAKELDVFSEKTEEVTTEVTVDR